jgi:hypothetical protein
MKSKYNGMYDPKNANQVCITGQLLLVDLLEKLDPYIILVQSNTDGIVVIPKNKDKVREIVAEWEKRTRIVVEYEYAKGIWQKDVNNYILQYESGDIKTKGGYVSQYHGITNFTIRNTRRIVDIAVTDYFVYDKPVEETINNCNDLELFQIITKTGGSYYKTMHVRDDGNVQVNKVNRVYATTDKTKGKLVKFKRSADGYLRQDSIANLPDNCEVDNTNIFDIKNLDRQYYIEDAIKKINDFIGEN